VRESVAAATDRKATTMDGPAFKVIRSSTRALAWPALPEHRLDHPPAGQRACI